AARSKRRRTSAWSSAKSPADAWPAACSISAATGALRACIVRLPLSDRLQPETLEKPLVVAGLRVVGGQEPLTVEDRVRAGHEAQCLQLVAHLLTPGRQAHDARRHRDAADRDGAYELE